MPKTHTVVLTRAAREAGVPLDELNDAALAAAANAKNGDIWFRAFRVRGRQFALSTRLVVEVDCFPHRAPQTVLPPPYQPISRNAGKSIRMGRGSPRAASLLFSCAETQKRGAMPKLVEHIDAMARPLGRDVLFAAVYQRILGGRRLAAPLGARDAHPPWSAVPV